MSTPVAIRPLTEITDEAFAADIRAAVPQPLQKGGYIAPALIVIIAEKRETLRDAALSLLQEYLGDIYRQRTVCISNHPEEIPARPPKEGATMEEYTYAPAFFSVSPETTKLPDEGLLDALRGPAPSTTRLAKTMTDFTRWDMDIFIILSPLEMFSWQSAVTISSVGMMCFATIERAPGAPVHIGDMGMHAFDMIGGNSPKGNALFIDLDQKKVFKTLADANVVA